MTPYNLNYIDCHKIKSYLVSCRSLVLSKKSISEGSTQTNLQEETSLILNNNEVIHAEREQVEQSTAVVTRMNPNISGSF